MAILTRAHGDDTDAARLAMALDELRLGEIVWHELGEDSVRMLASLPNLGGGALQHLGVRQSLRHGGLPYLMIPEFNLLRFPQSLEPEEPEEPDESLLLG
jgi:hypothetical protein